MRNRIRAELQSIAPLDAIEEQQIRSSIDWIDSGAELIRRRKPATPPRHLVSYFALIDGDWILLVDHINANLWLPPGGHVEAGETPRQTVEREIQEELGIPADFLVPHPIFLTVTETVGLTAGHVDVSLWFALKGCRDQPLNFDRSEFREVHWFHRDALPLDRVEPNLVRFMCKLGRGHESNAGFVSLGGGSSQDRAEMQRGLPPRDTSAHPPWPRRRQGL